MGNADTSLDLVIMTVPAFPYWISSWIVAGAQPEKSLSPIGKRMDSNTIVMASMGWKKGKDINHFSHIKLGNWTNWMLVMHCIPCFEKHVEFEDP